MFLDTPGFHRARTRLGEYMDKVVRESVADVDAVVLVIEPIPSVGKQEAELIRQIKASGVPAVLAVNKIDTVEKPDLLAVIAAYAAEHDFAAIVPVSAKRGEGLDVLFDELHKFSEEGPHLFPDDVFTDQPEKQLCAEILREKLLWCLEREVPHGTAVVISRFSEREDGVIELDATIYCEKSSHKGIIIGKNGAMLKKIGEMARKDMETLLDTKVYLQTWVKVKENWRDSMSLLRNFGFSDN